MNRKLGNLLCCGAVAVCNLVTSGNVTIAEWNVQNTDKWHYDSEFNRITILETDADTFSFEAYDDSNQPADIDTIIVDSGIGSGTVRVQIAPDPNSSRTYGANDVGTVDLSNADYGELVDVNIEHYKGERSPLAELAANLL